MSDKTERDRFRTEVAPRLVEAVAGRPVPVHSSPRSGTRLSEWLAYFSDDRALFVVTGPGEHNLALAHGFYQAADKPLLLIMPVEESTTAEVCAPWIRGKTITLWTYEENEKPIPVELSKERSKLVFKDELVNGQHFLGAGAVWVEAIAAIATARHLDEAHRTSYQSWHFEGRQVLKMNASRKRVRITAGVDYSEPGPGRPAAIKLDLHAAPAVQELEQIEAAVDAAIKSRAGGLDQANAEHRLQAWLRQHPDQLGLTTVVREVPAIRGGGRAYIDLLGVDAEKRLHVVETKIGTDESIVIQGLEYWVWASAHLEDLTRTHHAWNQSPRLDFAVQRASTGNSSLFDRYSCSLAQALDPDVQWRIHEVSLATEGFDVVALPDGSVDAPRR